MDLIWKVTCGTYPPASPNTRSTASPSYCPGISRHLASKVTFSPPGLKTVFGRRLRRNSGAAEDFRAIRLEWRIDLRISACAELSDTRHKSSHSNYFVPRKLGT